jgi:hypothetical protein
MDITGGV